MSHLQADHYALLDACCARGDLTPQERDFLEYAEAQMEERGFLTPQQVRILMTIRDRPPEDAP
jgi:hypothetical protein